MWPQIIVLIWFAIEWGYSIGKHGQLEKGKQSYLGLGIAYLILIVLLWWGGFWDCFWD